MKTLFLWIMTAMIAAQAQAEIKKEPIEYKHGDTVLEGYLAYDDAIQGKRPGVVVVHEWRGLNDYAKRRAEQLAELGYIAFALDMYGKGVYAKDHDEAGKLSGVYRSDRKLMRERAKAGLEILKRHPMTDQSRMAAIGYCFGGTTVLELARSGEDLRGVVSFHGGLSNPKPEDAKNIKGRVLVLHGANDKFISSDEVSAFQEEMRNADVDWQMIFYGGAVHSFTVPEAGNDPSKGMAYNEKADKRSWEEMKRFFNEIFK
jgi:dienelactone hydrolase